MKYDIDDLLKEAYKSREFQEENRPSNILNQETISRMREINNMKKAKRSKFRLVTKLAVGLACVGVIVSVSTVTYSAMTKSNNNYYRIEMDDGKTVEILTSMHYKDLPQDKLPKVESGSSLIPMTWDELEGLLGFSLLGGASETDDKVYYFTYLNKDNSIASVHLWIPDYKLLGEALYSEEGDKYYSDKINLSIDIIDAQEESEHNGPHYSTDAWGGKQYEETYYIKSLDTEAVFYHPEHDENNVTATFGYDGVYYTLQGYNVTSEEMKEVIENMK